MNRGIYSRTTLNFTFLMTIWISSRFLCPSPPLLLSAPNQNRHATQAKSQIVRRLLQSFIPFLFSLLVTVKLKPEIISQGDRQLIVNTTILETWPLEES